MCVCVCVYAVPCGHAKKGVLNQRQLQEVTAVTTPCLKEMGTLNSMFTYKTLSIIFSGYMDNGIVLHGDGWL